MVMASITTEVTVGKTICFSLKCLAHFLNQVHEIGWFSFTFNNHDSFKSITLIHKVHLGDWIPSQDFNHPDVTPGLKPFCYLSVLFIFLAVITK